MKFFSNCILHFYDKTCFRVRYLLKAEGHYYYILNCWERKKNKDIFVLFFPENRIEISYNLSPLETVRMKCQILFYGKNKKDFINLSSAESAHSVVKILKYLSEKKCYKIMLFLNNGFIYSTFLSDDLLTKLLKNSAIGNFCK